MPPNSPTSDAVKPDQPVKRRKPKMPERTMRCVMELDVEHLYSKDDGREGCICCPTPTHRFGANAPIISCEPDIRSQYRHLADVDCTISGFIQEHGRHGKRVRITVEEINDAR